MKEANTAAREETPATIRDNPPLNIAIREKHTHTSQLDRSLLPQVE